MDTDARQNQEVEGQKAAAGGLEPASKPNRTGGPRAFWRIVALCFLVVTGLCAAPFDDFVLLIDTSGSVEDREFRAKLLVSLNSFADTVPADGASRIQLFTYDTVLRPEGGEFVLSTPEEKTQFKLTVANMAQPRGKDALTWTAFMGALNKLSARAKDSRSISIHLFVDGVPKDASAFAQAFAQFSKMRGDHRDLRLSYHAIGLKPPPAEVTKAATPGSGLIVLRGIQMPPQILRERVLPAGTSLLSGQPRAWIGVAVGSPDTWQWNFGDGQSGKLPNPTHTYAKSGKYALELVAANSAGEDRVRFDVEVKAGPPKAAFKVQLADAGAATVFTDASEGEIESWKWTIDGLPAGEGREWKHVFPVPGKFRVALTVDGPGKSNAATQEVTIAAAPKVQFSWTPKNAISNAPVAFINESSGMTDGWEWKFGDGGSSTERHPQHTYARAGKYPVTLSARGPAGPIKVSMEITVAEPQWRIVASPQPTWQGKPASFLLEGLPSSELQVSWEFGDGSQAETAPAGKAVEHAYGKTGDYIVRAKLASSGGGATSGPAGPELKISVQTETVAVDFTAKAHRSLAAGPRLLRGPVPLTVHFENLTTGPVASYAWDFGDGTTSNDRSPSHTYSRVGTYRVRLRVIDQFQGSHGTTDSQQFEMQATGWRPPKAWRWPALVALAAVLWFTWYHSTLGRRRIHYQQDGKSRTHRSWTKDLTLRSANASAKLKLRRSAGLRKSYVVETTGEAQWLDYRGDRRTPRDRARAKDQLVLGEARYDIKGLNHSAKTGMTSRLLILVMIAAAGWFTRTLFF